MKKRKNDKRDGEMQGRKGGRESERQEGKGKKLIYIHFSSPGCAFLGKIT